MKGKKKYKERESNLYIHICTCMWLTFSVQEVVGEHWDSPKNCLYLKTEAKMHSTLCTQVQCISKGQAQAISHTYPPACMVLCTCSKLEFQKTHTLCISMYFQSTAHAVILHCSIYHSELNKLPKSHEG